MVRLLPAAPCLQLSVVAAGVHRADVIHCMYGHCNVFYASKHVIHFLSELDGFGAQVGMSTQERHQTKVKLY